MRSKIWFTMLLCALVSGVMQAQQLPNSSFENFEAGFNNAGRQPVGWRGANVNKTVSGINVKAELVSEETDGYIGKCVRIHNESVGALGINENSPAWITLGTPWNVLEGINTSTATAGTDGGMAFTYRPDTLTVYIKRTYNNQEDANIVVYMWSGTSVGTSYKNKGGSCTNTTHTDEESDIRQQTDRNACTTTQYATQIGEGTWRSNQQFTTWTKVSIPITYYNNQVPEKINVICSSGNYPNFRQTTNVYAGSTLYVDEMRLGYSSQLSEIRINNRAMSGFNKDTYSYSYSLGQGATTVPPITCYRNGREISGSELSINYGAVGQPTTITVYAEDGSSSSTYTINFVGELSSNPRPSGIQIDGVSLSSFNPYVYSYNVELPYGSSQCPAIAVQYAEPGQTSTVQCSQIPGVATVTVFAENTSVSQVYTINFTVAALSDNTLQDILLGGVSIPGFSPTKTTYMVDLPVGTTSAPQIQAISAYPQGEQVIVIDDQGLTGTSTITVTPRGATNSRVYRITYRITASVNNSLQGIYLDGNLLTGYDPSVLIYNCTLPMGTTQLPAITWVCGDAYQSVVLESAGVEGVTKLTVTSQSGAVAIYRINFTVLKSSVSYLTDIALDGVSIAGFDSSVYTYNIVLPIGTTVMPVVSWAPGDVYQSINCTLGGLNGTTRIVVRAQDNSVSTYLLQLSVAQANNTTLTDLRVGGVTISGFDPEVTTYQYLLPRGTTVLPEVTYTAYDSFQTIRLTSGGVEGETRIVVRSQTGDMRTYSIQFMVDKLTDSALNGIVIGNDTLQGFHADSLLYQVVLASGTTQLPAISVLKRDESQMVTIQRGGVNGVTSIIVLAEDGSERTYLLQVSVMKSENALLDGILLDGVLIDGFDSQVFEYFVVLPDSATRCPEVSVVHAGGQSVVITSPRLTGAARIEVTPEEGAMNVYVVNFDFARSSVATLSDILLDGVSISGFESDSFLYNIVLPMGTESMPVISYVKGDSKQRVMEQVGNLFGANYLDVVAEDGSRNRYTIYFDMLRSSDATLLDIILDGVSINGFDANQTHYTYTLLPNSSSIPVLDYVKQNSRQNVELVLPVCEGVATLRVVAEDGVSEKTYEIEFAFAPFSNSALQGITLNGSVMSDFDADVLSYTIDVAANDLCPSVGYITADSTQHIAMATAGCEGSEIIVVAQDGSSRKYEVRFNHLLGTVSTLNGIELFHNGQWFTLPAFDAEVTDYSCELSWRSTTVPVINPIAAQKGQQITIAYGHINEPSVVTVRSEDGMSVSTYRINFPVEKSGVSTLSGINIGGSSLLGFDANTFEYLITLPYQTTMLPSISWEYAVDSTGETIDEQRVELTQRSLHEETTLRVIAEDGTESIYSIRFAVAKSDNENVLSMILVDGNPLPNFDGQTNHYNIVLPRGTTQVPAISYVKSYPEQVVMSNIGTSNSATILTVYSDKAGEQPVEYRIDMSISGVTDSYLTGIYVDGVLVPNFATDKTSYVVGVINTPVVTYTTADGIQVEEMISTSKHVRLNAFSLTNSDETHYDIYFYYVNDIIPNADFESWETATYNNANRPTGWTVPADVAEKYVFTGFGSGLISAANKTYLTGKEVNQVVGDGNSVVKLHTWSQEFSIHGGLPGMMTLGDMSISFGSGGSTSSSVSGGIQFRNTPDEAHMDYMQSSSRNRVNNMRFVYQLTDGTVSEELVFTDASFDDTWKHMQFPLSGSVTAPTQMNIIVNATHTENASDLGACSVCTSWDHNATMHVDNISFYYNNRLASISVDSVLINDYNPNVNTYTLTLPSEYVGIPNVSVVGEVPDQAYEYVWSGWENGVSTMTIKVMAENLSEYHYVLTFNRPASTNVNLNGLFINGTAVEGFGASELSYTYDVDYHYTQYPDVSAIVGSEYQTISIQASGDVIAVLVTAESGVAQTYTITLNRVASSSAVLWGLSLSEGSISFDPNVLRYDVSLAVDTKLPMVFFTKLTDGQHVIMNTSDTVDVTEVKVISEDSLQTVTYTVNFVREEVISSGLLSGLYLDGQLVSGFDASQSNYRHTVQGTENLVVHFTKEYAGDIIRETVTQDSVIIDVYGGSMMQYVLHYDRILSSSVNLSNIYSEGVALAEFDVNTYLYNVSRNRNSAIVLEAVVAEELQGLSVVYNPQDSIMAFDYTATSADNSASQLTRIEFTEMLESSKLLADILVNGTSLVLDTDTYSADAAFTPTNYNYLVTMKVQRPMQTLPDVPAISAIAGAYGQVITIENNGLNQDAIITVAAQDGTEAIYVVHVAVAKSDYAMLDGIAINLIPVVGFAPDNYSYRVTLDSRDETQISYHSLDAYQTIQVVNNVDSAVITVTAQDGIHHNEYVIYYDYILSSNSGIEAILLDGVPVSDFRPDSLDYAVQLPVGTILLPNISIINGDDSQNVIVTTGGINGITTIDVTAQDGTTTTYIIDFSVLLSENMALEMILLNHENLENGTPRFTVDNDFDSDITSYVVTLPVGTRQYPNITWTKGDDYQQVSLREINIGEFAIDVVAQDSAFTRTYWVTFQILRSQNALLHAIAVNGETLSTTANGYTVDLDFDPNTYTYQLLWPIGTTQLPVITFEAGDTMQTVVINAPQTLNDSIIISVQAEDPAFTSTYTIYCRLLLSENCLLEDISIAGTTLAGFRSDSLTYDVLLPIGTTILPEISWIQGDIYQTVSTVSGGVNSSYTITVKAQDTAFVTNYVINFQVELSHNAHLQALFADAQPINGFDMELFHYHLMLPYATTQVPVISYTASEPTQQITVLQAATLQDTAIVTVIAQDGISYNQYRITFQTMLSDNALLAGIYIDEEIIAMQATGFVADKDYDKDEFNYLITLPNGTTQMPEITWQGEVADYHDVVMNLGTVNGLTTITVTSQDQTDENIYRLTFQVAKSDNALLEDLRIYDKTVNGFDPMVFDYFIQFPIGTDTADLPTVEDVTYMIGHQGQVVSISQADPTTIAVIVTAEDGVAFNVYVISFEILLSDNALLKDIIIDGLSIKDFDPYTFDYSYLLFPGAQVPEIVPVKGEESQEVFLARAAVGEYTYIYVEAEDGTESTYSIFFTNSTDNPGDKPKSEDVCWSYLGDGNFKASTKRNNVSVLIFEPSGRLIDRRKLPLVDPNMQICEPSADGEIFTFEKRGQVYIYVFIYDKGFLIDSGKFIY